MEEVLTAGEYNVITWYFAKAGKAGFVMSSVNLFINASMSKV